MVDHEERITLTIGTPKVDAVEAAFQKILDKGHELDALFTKLATSRTLKINLGLEDGSGVSAAIQNVTKLASMLEQLGYRGAGQQIENGMVSFAKASQMAADKVVFLGQQYQKLNAEAARSAQIVAEMDRASQAMNPDRMKAHRQLLAARDATFGQLGMAQRAQAMAEAMEGLQVQTVAQAAAAQAHTTSTAAQAVAVAKATEATVKQAAAVRQVTDAEGALLKQRTLSVPGKPDSVTSTMLTGAGRTRTLSGASVVDEVRMEAAHAVAFARVTADFARKRAEVSGLGKRSPEMRALLVQEAKEVQDELGRMSSAGLVATPLFERQRGRAAGLLSQVGFAEHQDAAAEQKAVQKAASEEQRTARQRNVTILKEEMAEMVRYEQQMRLSSLTGQDLYRSLLHLGDAYKDLAFKISSVSRGDAGFESMRLQALKRGVAASNQANVLGHDLAIGATSPISKRAVDAKEFADAIKLEKQRERDAATLLARAERSVGRDVAGVLEERNAPPPPGTMSVLAKKFKSTLGNVAAYSASTAAIGVPTFLAKEGVAEAARMERQTASLRAVFQGTDAEAIKLRNDVLELAAATGRGGEEAVDAAIQWSRLGLTQKETAEAVRVSLVAANVAEMTTGEAATRLAAIYSEYKLSVRDLAIELEQINSISNNYNVTNKDMLDGIARTGAVAKQAGVPLQELNGLIAAIVSGTGRTGAEAGNAIKALITKVANPEVQGKLQDRFGVDVKDKVGELKDMSSVLAEIYMKTQAMNRTEKGEFLKMIGGTQQASRIETLLDNYLTGEVKAIKAAEDLGSVERENLKIRGTAVSQWQTLVTQAERFVTLLSTAGGEGSFLSGITGILKGVSMQMDIDSDLLQRYHAGPVGRALFGGTIGNVGFLSGKVADEYNRRKYGPELDPLEGLVAQTQSRRGAMEGRARLLGMAAKMLPGMSEERRGALAGQLGGLSGMEEVRTLIQKRDIQGAIAVLMQKQADAGEKAKTLRAEEAAHTKALVALLERRIELTSEPKKRDRLQAELSALKAQQQESIINDLNADFDPLAKLQRHIGRAIGYQGQSAGLLSDLPGVRGTESEKAQRELMAIQKERRMAMGLLGEGGEQAHAAVKNLLYGTGGKEGDLREGLLKNLNDREEDARAKARLATFRDDMAEGGRLAMRRMSAFDVGRNDTERLFAQGRGGIATANSINPTNAREAAELAQAGANLNQVQLSLEERRYKIARDIVQARIEENEQAQKALAFASREDQVRAALLARFAQANPGSRFTNNRFAFFDERTRRATEQFQPDLLPGGARTGRQRLEDEARTLGSGIDALNAQLNAAIQRAGRVSGSSMERFAPQFGIGGASGGTPQGTPPQINLPPVTFTFGKEINDILARLETGVRAELRSEVAGITARLDRYISGASRGAAQSGGADVISGD